VLKEAAMPIIVEATYEDGVLKPAEPLPLSEHERVRVTVEAAGWARRTQGMLRWTGDVETLRQIAESPEFDPQESA
jgi:predicted DNA-binding antitoxin AbrB/MazE fold protein